MNSEYKVLKYKSNNLEDFTDQISIEEPLEIIIKYKEKEVWVDKIISVTMRTPGDDEDLVRGFLFNEKVIEKINYIEKIETFGKPSEQHGLKNKIKITINNSDNIDIDKIKRNFLTNSSCGVCGKSSLETLEVIKKDKILKSYPKISKEVLISATHKLRKNQSEFSKTGGIHASGLFTAKGDIVAVKEDVGRHNALDKLIGCALKKNLLDNSSQFLVCSGRLNFDLVQKALMANIGILIGVGAPTSLAIDLANKFDMTLVGFVKEDSFNIYSNKDRIVINTLAIK
jgi:FdhD protein